MDGSENWFFFHFSIRWSIKACIELVSVSEVGRRTFTFRWTRILPRMCPHTHKIRPTQGASIVGPGRAWKSFTICQLRIYAHRTNLGIFKSADIYAGYFSSRSTESAMKNRTNALCFPFYYEAEWVKSKQVLHDIGYGQLKKSFRKYHGRNPNGNYEVTTLFGRKHSRKQFWISSRTWIS